MLLSHCQQLVHWFVHWILAASHVNFTSLKRAPIVCEAALLNPEYKDISFFFETHSFESFPVGELAGNNSFHGYNQWCKMQYLSENVLKCSPILWIIFNQVSSYSLLQSTFICKYSHLAFRESYPSIVWLNRPVWNDKFIHSNWARVIVSGFCSDFDFQCTQYENVFPGVISSYEVNISM